MVKYIKRLSETNEEHVEEVEQCLRDSVRDTNYEHVIAAKKPNSEGLER